MQHPTTAPYDYTDPFWNVRPNGKHHLGSDYLAPKGTPVYAICDGTVNDVRETSYNGKSVQHTIDGYGLNIAYIHLNEQIAHDGQYVRQGQLIGYSGNTGSNSQGPHLHITISDGQAYNGLGNLQDPWAFIEQHPNIHPNNIKGSEEMTVIVAREDQPGIFAVIIEGKWQDLQTGRPGGAQLEALNKIAAAENGGAQRPTATLSGEQWTIVRSLYGAK